MGETAEEWPPSHSTTQLQKTALETLLDALEANLTATISTHDTDTNQNPGLLSDASMMSCGCIVPESMVLGTGDGSQLICPNCHKISSLVGPITPLRNIYKAFSRYKANIIVQRPLFTSALTSSLLNNKVQNINNHENRNSVESQLLNNEKHNFISLFTNLALASSPPQVQSSFITKKTLTSNNSTSQPISIHSSSSSSSTNITNLKKSESYMHTSNYMHNPSSTLNYSMSPTSFSSQISNSITSIGENTKENFFNKCFPIYKKHYRHSTNPRSFLQSKTTFIDSSISYDGKYFVLLTDKKWKLYEISDDSNIKPKLLFTGKNSGEISVSTSTSSSSITMLVPPSNNPKIPLHDHLYCFLSNRYLAIAETGGVLRVYDYLNHCKNVYKYTSKFPILCLSISPTEKFVVCAMLGKNSKTNLDQPIIALHFLFSSSDRITKSTLIETNSRPDLQRQNTSSTNLGETANFNVLSRYSSRASISTTNSTTTTQVNNTQSIQPNTQSTELQQIDPIIVTFPYPDIIKTLQFSPDGSFMTCSTFSQCRFMVVNVTNPSEPRLIMKSMRKPIIDDIYEGITSVEFFPDNKTIVLSSVSTNLTPIVVNSQITRNSSSIAQPTIISRVNEVGQKIERTAVSPRGDAIAFIDKNGLLYLLYISHGNFERKKAYIVSEVTGCSNYNDAASIRFSNDGYKIYTVDRKGIFYIDDFATGLPQNHDMEKCKPLF